MKSIDWWGPYRCDPNFSGVAWDRWIFRGLYSTGSEGGMGWDMTCEAGTPFTAVAEECVGVGRFAGACVMGHTNRPDEPVVFRRSYFMCLDVWGDAGAAYVRAHNKTMPESYDAIFEDCTLVGMDNALQVGEQVTSSENLEDYAKNDRSESAKTEQRMSPLHHPNEDDSDDDDNDACPAQRIQKSAWHTREVPLIGDRLVLHVDRNALGAAMPAELLLNRAGAPRCNAGFTKVMAALAAGEPGRHGGVKSAVLPCPEIPQLGSGCVRRSRWQKLNRRGQADAW